MTRIYLGSTAEKHHVWADVEVEAPRDQAIVEFTDHTMGPRPERVSISFIVLDRPGNPSALHDKHWVTVGQVPPGERRVTTSPLPGETIDLIEQSWQNHHLNDVIAACDHMTPEMTAQHEGEPTHGPGGWQYRMLDTVVCPVTGYRWGSKWLVRTVDPDTIAALKNL